MAHSDPQSSEQEQFLSAVYLGSDLLGKGDLEGARTALREALQVRPDDAKARNLLGLSCFKLGHFDEAEDLYQKLVHENPIDATLRVNLGLVFLKSGRYEEAIRELSVAADLEPGHQRSQNYLGLAHARVGDYAQARECFAAAGSASMVEQMEEALAGALLPSPEASGTPAASHAFDAEVDLDGEDDDEEVVLEVDEAEEEEEEVEVDVEDEDEDEAPPPEAPDQAPSDAPPEALEEPEPRPPPSPPVEPISEPEPQAPAEQASSRASFGLEGPAPAASLMRLGRDEPRLPGGHGGEFLVEDGCLVIPVHGEVLSRSTGLVTSTGNLDFTPEVKRFRGRATEKPFGEGSDRFFRVRGEGQLILGLGETIGTCFTLDEVDGYFEESRVLAFEEAIAYENGRVPSSVSPDLNLVHLRGRGQVAVRSSGPIRAIDVHAASPLRAPLPHLVGWHGALTPRIAVLADEGGEGGEALVGIELVGEGVALLCLPASH